MDERIREKNFAKAYVSNGKVVEGYGLQISIVFNFQATSLRSCQQHLQRRLQLCGPLLVHIVLCMWHLC